MNTKLNNRPLYEDVADRLREQIFSKQLPPGSWLDEQNLADQFGISRTPMREAIKVLASEGLITIKMRRGAYVTEVARKDLEQIFTILSLLEGQAAKETATKATEDELNMLCLRYDFNLARGDQVSFQNTIQNFISAMGITTSLFTENSPQLDNIPMQQTASQINYQQLA